MHSMTGYGRGALSEDGRGWTMEIKTVNHRYLDVSFRLPRQMSFLEGPLRELIRQHVARGRVDVALSVKNDGDDGVVVSPDLAAIRAWMQAFKQVESACGLYDNIQMADLLEQPGLFVVTDRDDSGEAVQAAVLKLAGTVLEAVVAMRRAEGAAIAADLQAHLDALEAVHQALAAIAPSMPASFRDRLMARLSDAGITDADPQRIAQETALFADRCAIDEELARLAAHIGQMRGIIAAGGECGKRLDFLLQEMNREANTIASKSADIEVTRQAVEAKCIIEKLREQVQNVE